MPQTPLGESTKKGSFRKRRSRKQRLVIAKIIRFLTDFANDTVASNLTPDSFYTILDQEHYPREASIIKEAKWIFTKKVESGEITLRNQDVLNCLLNQYKSLTAVQKVVFLELLKNGGYLSGYSLPGSGSVASSKGNSILL